MRIYLVLLILLITASACQKAADKPSAEAKRFPFVGKVVSVDKLNKKATISHDAIPGYMDAMTMAFPIHDDWVWDDLTPGSEIHAELVIDNTAKDPFYLEKVGIIAAPDPNKPVPTDERSVQIGKPVPDFTLTNQDGKKISIEDFRGKALAVTFIYARCPLPDYCIRMSTNFSDLANQLKTDPEWKDKVRLLSISFDPENDTPAKLKSYGAGYLGNQVPPDFSIWQLAVGSDAEVRKIADFFGLDYRVDEKDKAVITHNLRTAVIDPQGNVTKIYSGNEWTPAELLSELKAAYSPQK
jgi:protein SCO1/2